MLVLPESSQPLSLAASSHDATLVRPQAPSPASTRMTNHWHCCLRHLSFWGVKPEELSWDYASFETNVRHFKPDS